MSGNPTILSIQNLKMHFPIQRNLLGKVVRSVKAVDDVTLRTKADSSHQYWLPHLPNRVSLRHRVVLADVHAEAVRPVEGEVTVPVGPIVSDTGELRWEDVPDDGRVVIDAPRHQAVIMRSGERSTANMTVSLQTRFAAIQLASMDNSPIAEAGRLLLVAVARVANTDMHWDASRTSVYGSVGGPPTRIERVQATLTLRGLAGARSVWVQPLDGRGQALGRPRRAVRRGASWVVRLTGRPATPWYEVSVDR